MSIGELTAELGRMTVYMTTASSNLINLRAEMMQSKEPKTDAEKTALAQKQSNMAFWDRVFKMASQFIEDIKGMIQAFLKTIKGNFNN